MHFRVIFRFVSLLTLFMGISMLLPLAASLYYGDGCGSSLLLSCLITSGAGLAALCFVRSGRDLQLNHRDGVAVVTLGWVTAGFAGTLPFLLSGAIPDFTNAYFESLSGFTTTGASILSEIEALPAGILLWRSQIQWLGGMGIIVLSIAILPFLGIGGMQLYKAEIPSPVVDKLKPRISETAKVLWKVYLLLTLIEAALLMAGGMSVFDAVCHAFCTMPTGGFSTRNASIAAFDSAYIETVIIIFMLIAGINFSLHYQMLRGNPAAFVKDPELRVFLLLFGSFTVIITLDVCRDLYPTVGAALRNAAFQVSSILTTTGFVSADYDRWPALSRQILLACMFLGGMAGSTGGGIKTLRIVLLFKQAYLEIFRIIHPHSVTKLKLADKTVPGDVVSSVWGFFILYLGLFVTASLLMSRNGYGHHLLRGGRGRFNR